MGMVNQATFRILCPFMKPDQFAPILWLWKILQVGGVQMSQEFVPEVLGVV